MMSDVRILIVDDDKEFLALLSKNIESWGYKTISASSGKEALKMIKNKDADIVILDYLMPEMDGVETLEKIRRIDTEVPAIMFTMHPDSRSIVGTEKLGILAYVPKVGVFTDPKSSLKAAIGMAEKGREEK
jgi:DNA-binding NtrC family response regulator